MARAALLALLLLAGCATPGLDADQALEERRTCASLRERVAARALERGGLPALVTGADPGKADDLAPTTLATDPQAFYAALEERLAAGGIGPTDTPSSVSPASRLVERCRRLGP